LCVSGLDDHEQVGADTVEELNRQKEQIAEITDTVSAMEDGLTRADKLIRVRVYYIYLMCVNGCGCFGMVGVVW
jgi:hypothetical protein